MKKDPLTIIDVLKGYKGPVATLVFVAIMANVLALFFPKLIAQAIDSYIAGTFDVVHISTLFLGLSVIVLLFTFSQTVMTAFVSERSARDLRSRLVNKISTQSYMYTQEKTPSFLLTNLTSDVDAVKSFIGNTVPGLVSALLTLIGAAILILMTDWKLGLGVLSIIPVIGIAFYISFSRMGKLFGITQGIVDRLNTVINSTIVGAALVRVLNSGKTEFNKFESANADARDNGMKILMLFALLIPIITFAASLASLVILYLGGKFVIVGSMTLGQFAAFNSYISILLFPIFVIGFSASSIGMATASMFRIRGVFDSATEEIKEGLLTNMIKGDIEVDHLTLQIGEKKILDDISFKIKKGSKTAIIGPTGAGKSQLLAVLSGLVKQTKGTITFDGAEITAYHPDTFYASVGLVFQDSVLFNLSLKDNIAFGDTVTEEHVSRAIEVAELGDFVDTLPKGLDTLVSERGVSLSGGQKQRVMLARALAIHPSVLLLDDFTARVDAQTEKSILENLAREYPDLTLISVTQKISSIEAYDQIILLVEGELINSGTHEELMSTTPEYVQIYESQKSTTHYELQS